MKRGEELLKVACMAGEVWTAQECILEDGKSPSVQP